MGALKVRRPRTVAGVLVVAAVLSGCSPFEMDPGVMRELDEEVASWNLTSAGDVVAECSESASLGAQYGYTLVLRGDRAWEEVQQRLADAGFEPSFTGNNDYGKASFERTDPAGTWWSAGVDLIQGQAAEDTYCSHTDAKVGDMLVGFIAIPEDSR